MGYSPWLATVEASSVIRGTGIAVTTKASIIEASRVEASSVHASGVAALELVELIRHTAAESGVTTGGTVVPGHDEGRCLVNWNRISPWKSCSM